jgi:hypothetical protein
MTRKLTPAQYRSEIRRIEQKRRQADLPPENWSSENESPHGWGNAPRRTACVAAGLRRSRLLAC